MVMGSLLSVTKKLFLREDILFLHFPAFAVCKTQYWPLYCKLNVSIQSVIHVGAILSW